MPTTICFVFAKCVATKESQSHGSHFRLIAVNLAAIDPRLHQLTQTAKKSSYSKQKSSLRVEFETILASLPSVRSSYSATPEDVSRFLVWKDRHGKKIVHVSDCVNSSDQNASDCGCPKRRAFKTVDSNIGKPQAAQTLFAIHIRDSIALRECMKMVRKSGFC